MTGGKYKYLDLFVTNPNDGNIDNPKLFSTTSFNVGKVI